MEIDYTAIGKRVKKFRKSRRLSQEQLAELLDISVPHMSNIENGKTKFSLQVLLSLAEALNVTPDALLVGLEDGNVARSRIIREIITQLKDCNEGQMQLLMDMFNNFKKLLRRYEECVKQQRELSEISELT